MKKLAIPAIVLGSAVASMAQTTSSLDPSAAIDSLATVMTGVSTSVTSYGEVIVGALLGLAIVGLVIRFIKRVPKG